MSTAVSNERARIAHTIEELEGQLARARQRSRIAADPSYQRTEQVTSQKLEVMRTKLKAYDDKQSDLAKARRSKNSQTAIGNAKKAAKQFEADLLKAAQSAEALKKAGGILAAEMQVWDAGVWPSRNSIDIALRARVIKILGDAGIKLDGYDRSQVPSMVDRFGGGASK